MKKIHICKWCKKEFYFKNGNRTECCSKSCASRLSNFRRGFGQTEIRHCRFCGKEMEVKKSSPKQFCNRSCLARDKVTRPEFHQKLHNAKVREKISQSQKRFAQTEKGKAYHRKVSERMKKNNPSRDPKNIEKMKNTKRIKGTLNVWPGVRGGNGHYTPAQLLLAVSLGWQKECVISLDKRQHGFPTCYKVDIGSPELKIGIEVDGKGHRTKKAILKDVKKTNKLKELGWKILRFTNEEVMTNLSRVLLEIKKEIKAL